MCQYSVERVNEIAISILTSGNLRLTVSRLLSTSVIAKVLK